jgi:DNA-binding MarR family transcriptional regulator
MTEQLKPDVLAFRVMNEIGIISQLASTAFEQVMPGGVTVAQFSVLNHFVRLGGRRRPSDLARSFQVSKGTMTSTLGRLKSKGLVSISGNESDRRGRLVEITPAGVAMHAACIEGLTPLIRRLLGEVGMEPFQAAIGPLTLLRQTMDRLRG